MKEHSAFASPPCFMHEIDPATGAVGFDPQQWRDVARWRKAERERLIAARLAISAETRAAMAERIGKGIDAVIGDAKDRIVSLYWPFRGEPDLRPWLASIVARGAIAAMEMRPSFCKVSRMAISILSNAIDGESFDPMCKPRNK